MTSRETVQIDNRGTEVSVSIAGGKVQIISEMLKDEKWFRITRVLVEHLFHEQLNWPNTEKKDEWMLLAAAFAYTNAGCSIFDARTAVQMLDCFAARKSGCQSRRAYSLYALKSHDVFGDWMKQDYESSDDEDDSDSEGARKRHNGMVEGRDLERRDWRTFGMVLSQRKGWFLTCPVTKSISVVFPGFYKGILFIQNRKFYFNRKTAREREDRMHRAIAGPQVMPSGLKHVSEPEEETAQAVAEMVLSGKAGAKAGRWVLRHLMHGSVDIGGERPTYLKHLPVEDDGMDINAVVGMNVIVGLEVAGMENDNSVHVASTGIVPEYKIVMKYQGYAEFEECEAECEKSFGASLRRGPAVL